MNTIKKLSLLTIVIATHAHAAQADEFLYKKNKKYRTELSEAVEENHDALRREGERVKKLFPAADTALQRSLTNFSNLVANYQTQQAENQAGIRTFWNGLPFNKVTIEHLDRAFKHVHDAFQKFKARN